jgi:hypothetical protein
MAVAVREAVLYSTVAPDHLSAKAKLQRTFFATELRDDIPVFCFVGRITEQKGVHLIVNTVEELVRTYVRGRGRVGLAVATTGARGWMCGLRFAVRVLRAALRMLCTVRPRASERARFVSVRAQQREGLEVGGGAACACSGPNAGPTALSLCVLHAAGRTPGRRR